MRRDFFKILPSEIISNILLRLSVRSIAISKCVCKPWLQLFQDDDFIKSHFAKSSPALALKLRTRDSNLFHVSELEEDELNLDRRHNPLTRFDFSHEGILQGSANGLLFLSDLNRHDNALYVCNPITREFCRLLCSRLQTYGFGVSRISGQYKVVSFDPQGFDEQFHRRFMCYVYTLGTGSWRRVEAATDSFDRSPITVGAFAHGNLHWMASPKPDGIERISCFDLETECFSIFSVPPLRRREMCRCVYALRDSIVFCDESSEGGGFAIWIMKEYGDENSWSMDYVINPNFDDGLDAFQLVYPIQVFKNGDVLVLCGWRRFIYYSNKTKTSQEIGGFFGGGEDVKFINALLVTPSMVSLKCFSAMENVTSF